MKIGMEPDRVEDIDREVETVIASAAAAYFSGADDEEAMERLDRLAAERVELTTPSFGRPMLQAA
jgi:hypothetical protein